MYFKPFSDPILNISNPISEGGILLIFLLLSINLLKVPSDYHDKIDEILVGILNGIMAVQMIASILIFIVTIILLIKKRREKKITPVESFLQDKNEFDKKNSTDLNYKDNTGKEFQINNISRVENKDDALYIKNTNEMVNSEDFEIENIDEIMEKNICKKNNQN